ncbi:hypothetical protein Cgig2_014301 [Carnegiea gigantea]|uniref:Ribosomal RNA-processing protein 17 n=1 Tax=Carnegiea gigantea TaxID=171969 RepID=A0A9Q1JW23_9CARY|nr:hypothetical protein Cgig2_014301 [Carnegiea gigantea]
MEDAAEGVAVAGQPPIVRGQRINKRSLRNKSLSVTFNEKDLRDFVSGFHKRKKKRRKEALRKQEEAERRRRLEKRKRARLEKEYALYGGAPPASDAESDGEDQEHDDESELNRSVSGIASFPWISSLVYNCKWFVAICFSPFCLWCRGNTYLIDVRCAVVG